MPGYADRHESDPEPSDRRLLARITEDKRLAPDKSAAIAAPTAPGAVYLQAEAQSAVAAINAIRTALTKHGITL